MTRQIVSRDDARAMPWKNGGGSTAEIATRPPGAGLDDFEWRASIATIGRDGPFSAFPGVDRTLVLLSGPGVRFVIEGNPVVLDAPCATTTFSGDVTVECTLLDGPTSDFNFMWRRAQATAQVGVTATARTLPAARSLLCHAVQGQWTCAFAGAAEVVVDSGDTLVIDDEDAADGLRMVPGSHPAAAIVIAVDARAS